METNGREPKSYLGLIFNFKFNYFNWECNGNVSVAQIGMGVGQNHYWSYAKINFFQPGGSQ